MWCEVSSLAVILTGDIPVWLSLLVLILMPWVGLARENSPWLGSARGVTSILAIAYLLFFPLDWLFFSDRLIFAVVHLIFYLKVHTLLHLQTGRDRRRLYVLCLFEMLAAASMTITLAFVLPLVLFVLLGSLVLLLEQATDHRTPFDEPALLRRASATAGILGAVVLVLAGMIFVFLPRSSQAGFRLGGVRGITSTGFSEQIRLGDFGEIKRSRDVVMRILLDERQEAPAARWRGAAYDRYLDGEWGASLADVSELPRSESGEYLLNRPSDEKGITSEVFLDPLDTDLVFLPPASLRLMTSLPNVFVDAYLAVRTGRSRQAGRHYSVEWLPDAAPDSTALGAVPLDSESERYYLQLPLLSEDFSRLVDEVVPAGRPVRETAAIVERYLESTYDYTLTTPARTRPDPLEDFLFEARAGHCEYFATAMVMMMRARGIPARLVTGFQAGEINDLGNFEVVRKEDAHAWVEVFDRSSGWLTFDPTPAATFAATSGSFEFVTLGVDSLRMLWDMYVITFDYDRQRGVWREASRVLGWTAAAAGATMDFATRQRKASISVAVVLLLGLALASTRMARAFWTRLRFRWPFRPWTARPRGSYSAVRFYGDLLARLERMGFHRTPGSTPGEFAQALESQLPGLIELTRLYYQVRFGGVDLGRNELTRAERLATVIHLAALAAGQPVPVSAGGLDRRVSR
jgi:transglutaminase-like putative cysteine protease